MYTHFLKCNSYQTMVTSIKSIYILNYFSMYTHFLKCKSYQTMVTSMKSISPNTYIKRKWTVEENNGRK